MLQIINNYMGACCIEKQIERNYSTIVSDCNSFYASDSSYDEKFVWFPPLNELNLLMRQLIERPNLASEPQLTRLDCILMQLNQELGDLAKADSEVSIKLGRISQMLEQPHWGYLLFEIQRI